MRKLAIFLLSVLLCYPIFSVDYTTFRKNDFNEWVIIATEEKTRGNLAELGDYFRNLNKENKTAFVYIYDDVKAAAMWDRIDFLTDSESDFYDRHFVGVFWKGIGENTRYDFTIMPDGINGKSETIKYDRKDDKKIIAEKTKNKGTEQEEGATQKSNPILSAFPFVLMIGIIAILANWKKWRYKVWFEFFVAVFLGTFGVQKFRERKYALGVLYVLTLGVFYIGWLIDCIRYFVAAVRNRPILPVTTKKELENAILDTQKKMIEIIQSTGQLPIVEDAPIILGANETCHYSQDAYYIETKNMVVGRKSTGGARSTTFLGVRYSAGGAQSQSIRGDVTTRTAGILTITSERIIFTARKGAFNKKLSELTSLVPEGETVAFQFGEKYHALQTNTVDLIVATIKTLLQPRSD